MPTLEPDQRHESVPAHRKPSVLRRPATAIAVVVVVVATATASYAVGASHTKTETVTVVRKTASTPTTAAALKCVPGAAPGSCNIDEASEIGIPDEQLDPATRATLAVQLVAARNAAMQYPTVADAQRAGFVLAGGYAPLSGAHYMDFAHSVGTFDAAHPGSYIYDGTKPTSKIIGLMYLGADVLPPQGFAGPNDRWHRHTNTCVIFTGNKIVVPFAADSDVTKDQCDAQHGTFMRRTIWMVHAWVVPGWESPVGVFAHDNPDVKCADGTTHTDAVGFCKGSGA